MILGLGIDIIGVERMARAMERNQDHILDRLFSPAERADAGSGRERCENLAARFAAKEAAMKALGSGWSGGLSWQDIEVVRERCGRTRLRLTRMAAESARVLGVSASHLALVQHGNLAAAVVILEGFGPDGMHTKPTLAAARVET